MTSPLRVVDFADNIIDKTIHFKIILMNDSFFVWIGAEPKMSNMSLAMPTKYIALGVCLLCQKSAVNTAYCAPQLQTVALCQQMDVDVRDVNDTDTSKSKPEPGQEECRVWAQSAGNRGNTSGKVFVVGSTPSSSSLLKSKAENNSSLLAQKLAKRFSKQVFVSCSLPFDQQVSLQVEKRLSQELGTLL